VSAYTVEHSDLDAATAASSWEAKEEGTYESVRAYACEHEDRHLPHCDGLAVTA
jgi:hypothetical protein